MRIFFSVFAWAGFFAALLVHSITFWGISAADYVPWVWVLHVGCFVAIIPLIRKDIWRDVVAVVPPWAKILAVFFMAYAMINFVLSFALSEGGANPDIWDGKYVLQSHGNLVRELSETGVSSSARVSVARVLWTLDALLFFARDLFLVPKRLIASPWRA